MFLCYQNAFNFHHSSYLFHCFRCLMLNCIACCDASFLILVNCSLDQSAQVQLNFINFLFFFYRNCILLSLSETSTIEDHCWLFFAKDFKYFSSIIEVSRRVYWFDFFASHWRFIVLKSNFVDHRRRSR